MRDLFKIGDVVTLNSGGIPMTINSLNFDRGKATLIYLSNGKIIHEFDVSFDVIKIKDDKKDYRFQNGFLYGVSATILLLIVLYYIFK